MTDTSALPAVAIAVAPNGARKTRADHPALPVTPAELAACARDCLDAGAAMLHLHVRRADGRHSLAADDYRPAIEAVRRSVGDALVLQLTSEAVGIYAPPEQIAMVRELRPEAVSVALRELVPDADHETDAADFFGWMARERIVPQYILYSDADVLRYLDLRRRGLIPPAGHGVLFVLGRYSAGQRSAPSDLLPFLTAWHGGGELTAGVPWSMCAFGAREAGCALTAALLGGHVRVGFENNMLLPDGSTAADNAALVRGIAERLQSLGLTPMTAAALRTLYHPDA